MNFLRLPGRVPLRLRFFFRGAFALLTLVTLALAVNVLGNEKQRGQRAYAEGLQRSHAQIAARLRHPTGQLMLLNPAFAGQPAQPGQVLMLPFGALDFDDRAKARQAVEMAGCAWQWPDGATLCSAVGSNPYAGGFVYLVGSFAAGDLVEHRQGELDLASAHRVAIELVRGSERWRWIAPYAGGRLTGFADAPVTPATRPVRDFRGWLWQEPQRNLFSVRLPVEVLREALARKPLQWPPPELAAMRVRVQVLPPGGGAPLFDSASQGAVLPFSLADLQPLLLPGETLTVRRAGREVLQLKGAAAAPDAVAPWLAALIRRLPVEGPEAPLLVSDSLPTPLGAAQLELAGDLRSVNRQLAAVATRVSGFVAAMLGAVLLTWLAIEVRVIRRITLLTRRAAAVSSAMKGGGDPPALLVADLRGSDELAVLAQGLQDLLARVHEDTRREQIRAQQEKDQWHAVGHEIMSPLQSLMALHADPADPSARYITRMQQAVRVLYGQASPSEAFEATSLQLQAVDLDAFFAHVAGNAAYIGIDDVDYAPAGQPLRVKADEYSLEDVVTHVLRNAARHRTPGTSIRITLAHDLREARALVRNDGEAIDPALIERIFEYGVSGATDGESHRGQGLFVARTYMAKMGGTITAANVEGGVAFTLTLQKA